MSTLKDSGTPGLGTFWPFDDGLIGLHTADHIVGLNRQDFLQGIGSAISFQSPHFHLAETLAAELGFTAQRLLRHQRVRTGGTGMDLIVYQMVQLEDSTYNQR